MSPTIPVGVKYYFAVFALVVFVVVVDFVVTVILVDSDTFPRVLNIYLHLNEYNRYHL